MSAAQSLSGRILTPKGWVVGRVEFDARVTRIVAGELTGEAPTILPGFVDLHVPGGGGADAMAGAEAVRTVARTHARHGTTTLLPATVTAPLDAIGAALGGIAAAKDTRGPGEARVLGAHMEGPFINPGKLGAQPPYPVVPDDGFLGRIADGGTVKLVTLAPEVEGAMAAIARLAEAGIAVQIGHTDADYETACAALDAGAKGFTHLFNAMSALHHRKPGVVGAALAKAEYAALIPDMIHVAPGAVLAALRAIPRLFCVTDAVAAAGMPDGDYPLGSHTVTKRGEGVYLGNDTLAGSALTMDAAYRNLRALGLSPADTSHRLSAFPAAFLGLRDRGIVEAGAWADFVVLDAQDRVQRVFVEGEEVNLQG